MAAARFPIRNTSFVRASVRATCGITQGPATPSSWPPSCPNAHWSSASIRARCTWPAQRRLPRSASGKRTARSSSNDLCENVTHLVPQDWRTLPPCQNAPAARFFEQHYAYRTYANLQPSLIQSALELLETNGRGVSHPPPPQRRSFQRDHTRISFSRKENLMTTASSTPAWQQLPGLAREIAAGADGSLFCLGIGEMPSGGYSIHRFTGADWETVDGASVKIAAGPDGQPAVINREHQIFRFIGDGFEMLPGLAREIAIGADGSAWCVSAADFAPGGGSIHVWNGRDWDAVAGAAVKIAVGPDGMPWVVNSAGQIFRRFGEGWEMMPGRAREIGIGADGTVYCLGAGEMPAGGFSIHRWNGADWDLIPGAAVRLAAGPAGSLFVVNSENAIFRST